MLLGSCKTFSCKITELTCLCYNCERININAKVNPHHHLWICLLHRDFLPDNELKLTFLSFSLSLSLLPSSIGFASSTCCSIQECWPLMAARNWRISLVLSVFPAPDSPLSNQNNSEKMWSCLRKTNDFKRLFIILKFLMILRDLQHLHFYQFLTFLVFSSFIHKF